MGVLTVYKILESFLVLDMRKDIFISSQNRIIRIKPEDIVLVEATREYRQIKTTSKNYLVHTPIIKLESILYPHGFLRVHRKFIIPISRISHVERKHVFLDDLEIPIGYSFYKNFLKQLDILL